MEWWEVNPCSLRKQYSAGGSELTSHWVEANSSDLNKSTEDSNEMKGGRRGAMRRKIGQKGRMEKAALKS